MFFTPQRKSTLQSILQLHAVPHKIAFVYAHTHTHLRLVWTAARPVATIVYITLIIFDRIECFYSLIKGETPDNFYNLTLGGHKSITLHTNLGNLLW